MYFNARYYSSELGRFISRDPIGIADDVNLYVYVGNNPLKWVDPSGMLKKFINNIIVNIEKGGTITKDKVYDIGTITALNIIMK
ncbi:MAG: RHS repeat-associated core domain-containing protein [Candidatus Peribacteria bacterium]|nr:RHS repeat-associated core domain-containing protein [Candidatus Peribacteria bacterium]